MPPAMPRMPEMNEVITTASEMPAKARSGVIACGGCHTTDRKYRWSAKRRWVANDISSGSRPSKNRGTCCNLHEGITKPGAGLYRSDSRSPMRQLPSLNGLRAFEASARLGSFTAAATELNVTQAAISRSVKLLEAQVGCPLFDRRANALAL